MSFFLLMNQKDFLRDNAPTGGRRFAWNLLMGVSTGVAVVGSVYMVFVKAGLPGIAAVALLGLLAVLVHINRVNTRKYDELVRKSAGKQKK